MGYKIISKLIVFLGNIWFGGKIYGKENIPKEGRVILAGNHTGNFDSYLLFKSTNRTIHILGKIELFKGPFGFIFKMMKLIPVDRKGDTSSAKEMTINLLNEEEVVGIFPEGTFHKKDILLPFKPGVISFATKTNSLIIPFAITGEFKFRAHPSITWGKPIDINKIKTDKVEYLENVVRELITKEKD